MKLEEMQTMEQLQLFDQVEEWKKELLKLRIEASIQKKAESPHKFKELRRNIARALTVNRQKEMEGK